MEWSSERKRPCSDSRADVRSLRDGNRVSHSTFRSKICLTICVPRERAKKLITNGGHVRGIKNISFYYVDAVRQLLDIGEDVRHVDNSQEVLIFVRDKMESVSSINAVTNELLLNDQIVAFWSEGPTYAEYLLSHFDQAWAQSVDAQERIRELLEQGY